MKKYQVQFEEMREKLKPQMPFLFSAIGFDSIDFTMASLKKLENTINRMYPLGHEPMSTTLMMIGLYVGEVLIKNIPGARWNIKGENPFKDWEIKIDMKELDQFTAYPVQRVRNFWFDRTDTIWGWAGMIRDLRSGALDPSQEAPFRWQQRPDGTSVRFVGVHKKK